MLRNEIQNKTGLTRKAIEYYEVKGFIKPTKNQENGYRNYSDSDLEILNRISLYRKLGLSICDIEKVINSPNNMLSSILRKKQRELMLDEKRKTLLEQVVLGEKLENISLELSNLEREENIYSKLERVFPGYFGQCFFAAYKPFLNEPIADGGESAYQEYVEFLDKLPELELTSQEEEFIESATSSMGLDTMDKVNEDKIKAIEDAENWLEENKDIIEQYEQFKNSEEYLSSPLKTIQDKLTSYMAENKYYDVAIPLIRKFSESYDLYYKKLLAADEAYLKMKDKKSRM